MKKKSSDVYAGKERKYMHKFQEMKDKLFSPFLKLLMILKITPNMLSVMSLILGVLFVVFISKDLMLSLLFLILSVFFDGIDGSLARFSNKVSKNGALVDQVCDHSMIVLSAVGFVMIGLVNILWGIVYVLSYTLLVFTVVARNKREIPFSFVLRPRLFVYLAFLIFVVWNVNLVEYSLMIFSVQMLLQGLWGVNMLWRDFNA